MLLRTSGFIHPPTDPSFPPAQGSVSFWQQGTRADPIVNARTTPTLPATADVVIIGSGISGALVAWNLIHGHSPPRSVVMLEAREACSGATGKWVLGGGDADGRNAGHCRPDIYRGFPYYRDKFGTKQALKARILVVSCHSLIATQILDNEWQTYQRLVGFIKQHKIDCDLWVGDTYDVAVTSETRDRLKRSYDEFAAAGGDVSRIKQVLDPARAREDTRMQGALAYWAWPAATLHPVKLVYAVLQMCLDKGLNLQTHTPARRISRAKDSWRTHTDRGIITAPRIVHASNAFAPTLLPRLKPHLQPTPFVCTKIVPPPVYSGSKTLQNSYALWAGDGFLTINPRSNSDGIMLFGGDNEGYDHLRKLLEKHPERRNDDRLADYKPCLDAATRFAEQQLEGWPAEGGMAPGEGVLGNWSGLIGQTTDDLPFVGRVPGHKGQFVTAGHCGHGMARIFTASAAIAKMVLDDTASLASCGIPECFEMTEKRLGVVAAKL